MKQYLRKCSLIVANQSGSGLDLSNLRITFSVKKSDAQTPNAATIRVYNLAKETAYQIQKEFIQVVLQAGYQENYGVIFTGDIKQVRTGVENGVDFYLDIFAGDGDAAYNFSVVNKTLSAGASQNDQVNALSQALNTFGISQGYIPGLRGNPLPRGKVLYGMTRDYLRSVASSTLTSWSMQDGNLQMVPLTGLLPNTVVLLNSKSGMVGTPEQTNEGIAIKCLLNPILKIGGRVKIDQQDIQRAVIDQTDKKDNVNKPVAISEDGIYRLLVVEHVGDTRGNDWYSNLTCLDVDATAPENKKVKQNG